MGKYYPFKHSYNQIPISKNNFIWALKIIGKNDPLQIKKTRLKGKKPKPGEIITDKQFISRGILNVRKQLNRHLGKSGKYSSRMIRLCSEIKVIKTDDGTWLKSKIPYKDYKEIVTATYFLLKKCDKKGNKKYCLTLLEQEHNDEYPYQNYYKSKKYKTVAPIQTNTIVRVEGAKNESIEQFVTNFKENILREK